MSDPTRGSLLGGSMVLSATAAAAAAQGNPPDSIEGNKGATIPGPRDPDRMPH